MDIKKFKEFYKDYFPVGEGWRPLVEKLVDDITAIDPTIEISQIKEKFGGLRFYVWGATEEIFDLIEKAEEESYKICENCGTRENVTTKGGWILTLCDECREKKNG
jgi:NMD protein affecting ribosome stability and mRNA decay